jgi:hypothetical protein
LDFEYFDHRFNNNNNNNNNFLMLRGEIATPDHYHPSWDKTRGAS